MTHTQSVAAAIPPLPDPIPVEPQATESSGDGGPFGLDPLIPRPLLLPRWRTVRGGCYLLSYRPSAATNVVYDGTLRVECPTPTSRTASGDLYQRRVILFRPPWPDHRPIPWPVAHPIAIPGPGPSPAAGIPTFSRRQYRSYVRVTRLAEWLVFNNAFTLGFDLHRFDATTSTWSAETGLTARMSWIPAPAGYPSPSEYLEGDVRNTAGVIVGRLTMGWISELLRRATIEIDRVAASEAPLGNGAALDWPAVGRTVGWDLTVDDSNADVVEPSGESWSDAEAHASMLARRDDANLDREWRYHVLCVRRLDSTERGIMYDAFAGDTNKIPREGAAISSHWVIPNTPEWGLVQGQRFGASAAAYFRTAVHEIGHAMGLYHNTVDNGYMNTTNVIAASGTTANPFPTNIEWRYAADDAFRLRHMPDVYVRPGGTPFGTSYATTPISPADLAIPADGLALHVAPSLDSVPIGAPVRVDLRLVNTSDGPVVAPPSVGLKSGFTHGAVIDPSGVARTFSPLVLCLDREELTMLEPGGSVDNSLTLVRGGSGALFPAPGLYEISVEVGWPVGELRASVTGRTTVMVTSVVDEAHGDAARTLLSEPDTLVVLALGGDHLAAGIEAIRTALDNPVLRPHYEYIEARRVGKRFGDRPASPQRAAALLSADTVMNVEEAAKAEQLVEAPPARAAKKAPTARDASKKSTTASSGNRRRRG